MKKASKYKRRYGKLVEAISIPVDDNLKRIEVRVKSMQPPNDFDFNAWARDLLMDHIHEVLTEIGEEPGEDPGPSYATG